MSPVRRVLWLLLALFMTAAAVFLWPRPFGNLFGHDGQPRPDGAPGAATTRSSDAQLSVLLITIDTLRADALGAYGNRRAATPWIDRLAAAGARFESAHAHTVMTLPSHASILSGLYPHDHGVRDNAGFRFPAGRATLATTLQARGYATAAFISAFPLDSRFGLGRGFDLYDDGFVDAGPRSPLLEQERRGTETVALARRWLDAHAAARTFCWVHLYEPHAPYAPPEPYASRFRDDAYAGEVAAADAALEPLLRPLLDAGARAHTLVVLTGDHGESLGEHGEETHGVFAYESTLRVPLIVYAPSLVTAAVVTTPARHIDMLPTILEAVGIEAPSGLGGISLLAAARGRAEAPARSSYFEALSPSLNRGWAPLRGIVRGSLKYIDLPLPELYDLAVDPTEAHNLVEARPDAARELRELLATQGATAAGTTRTAESADARARLQSLGYVSATVPARQRYTVDDDPKRLIAIDAKLQEAVRLYTSGDREQALARAAALVRERPAMRVAWITLAQIQRDTGRLDAAIVSLRRAHALAPHDAQTAALLGAYLTERGMPADAVALLGPVAAGDAPDLQVLVVLGLAQARLGRAADAVGTLERARAAYPSNLMLLVHLGTVRLMTNQRDEARRLFAAAVAGNPELARAHSSLAAMDAEDGRTSEAAAHWREAVRIDPSEYGRILVLGMSFARAGRTAPARACFTFVAEGAPPENAAQIAAAREWLAANR